MVEPIIAAVWKAQPDVVVISGDFVQNGTVKEFRAARDFVERLPQPRITVPGNHDMPFRNIFRRYLEGLTLYREYISPVAEPFYGDDEIAIQGVNTARFLPLRGGRINEGQIQNVERRLCSLDGEIFKVLVTHHPFDLPERFPRRELVGRARLAMGRIAQSVDLLLAGHMHISHAASTALRYRLKGRSAIFVQAGTATSTRGRGEPNSFNLIRLNRPDLVIQRHQWNAEREEYACACSDKFLVGYEPPVCAFPAEKPQVEEDVEVLYPLADGA